MDYGCRADDYEGQDRSLSKNLSLWRDLWDNPDREEEKNFLILSHAAYVRSGIEKALGGVRLTSIELYHLRKISEEAIQRALDFQHFRKTHSTDRCMSGGLFPESEAFYLFFDRHFGISRMDIYKFGSREEDRPTFTEYLRREHARLNNEV